MSSVVFFGTPEWAVPSLRALIEGGWDLRGVVTNPDRPSGRGMKLTPGPVKRLAHDAGIEVRQPERVRDEGFLSWLDKADAEVAVVVAYGKILPPALLAIPRAGFVNVHFSLLPLYRGAAPVQRAVMDGRSETGVSIMVLTEGMDEGPVLASRATPIGAEETAGEIGERMAGEGAELLAETLAPFVDGSLTPEPQDDAAATYAPKLSPEEARLDWSEPARQLHDKVRGLNPAPGAWTTLGDQRLKVWRTRPADSSELAPGTLAVGDLLLAGTGSRDLALLEVQPAGKRRMSGIELANGLRGDGAGGLV